MEIEKENQVNSCRVSLLGLHRAILDNDTDGLGRLLHAADTDVNVCDKFGYSPLFVACRSGRKNMIWQLIERGANVNACENVTGDTALHAAAEQGFVKVVQYLVQIGADRTIANKCGRTPADVAMTPAIAQLLQIPALRKGNYVGSSEQKNKEKRSYDNLTTTQAVAVSPEPEPLKLLKADLATREREIASLKCEVQQALAVARHSEQCRSSLEEKVAHEKQCCSVAESLRDVAVQERDRLQGVVTTEQRIRQELQTRIDELLALQRRDSGRVHDSFMLQSLRAQMDEKQREATHMQEHLADTQRQLSHATDQIARCSSQLMTEQQRRATAENDLRTVRLELQHAKHALDEVSLQLSQARQVSNSSDSAMSAESQSKVISESLTQSMVDDTVRQLRATNEELRAQCSHLNVEAQTLRGDHAKLVVAIQCERDRVEQLEQAAHKVRLQAAYRLEHIVPTMPATPAAGRFLPEKSSAPRNGVVLREMSVQLASLRSLQQQLRDVAFDQSRLHAEISTALVAQLFPSLAASKIEKAQLQNTIDTLRASSRDSVHMSLVSASPLKSSDFDLELVAEVDAERQSKQQLERERDGLVAQVATLQVEALASRINIKRIQSTLELESAARTDAELQLKQLHAELALQQESRMQLALERVHAQQVSLADREQRSESEDALKRAQEAIAREREMRLNCTAQLDSEKEQCELLRSKYKNAKIQLAESAERRAMAETDIVHLRSKGAEKDHLIETMMGEMQSMIQDSEAQRVRASDITDLTIQVEHVRAERDSLKEQMDQQRTYYESQVADLETETEQLRVAANECAALKLSVTQMQAELAALSASAQVSMQERTQISDARDRLQTSYHKLENDLSDMAAAFEAERSGRIALEGTVSELKLSIVDHDLSMTTLQRRLDELTSEQQRTVVAEERAQAKVSDLQKQVSALESAAEALQSQLLQKEQILAETVSQVRGLKSSNSVVVEQLQQERSNVSRLEQKLQGALNSQRQQDKDLREANETIKQTQALREKAELAVAAVYQDMKVMQAELKSEVAKALHQCQLEGAEKRSVLDQLAQTEQRHQDAQRELSTVQQQLKHSELLRVALESRCEDAAAEEAKLRTRISQLDQTIREADAREAEIARELSVAQSRKDRADESLKALEADLQVARQRGRESQSQAHDQIERLQADLSNVGAAKDSLLIQLKEREHLVVKLQSQLEAKETTVRGGHDSLARLQAHQVEQHDELIKLQSELALARDAAARHSRELEDSNSDRSWTAQQLASLRAAHEQAEMDSRLLRDTLHTTTLARDQLAEDLAAVRSQLLAQSEEVTRLTAKLAEQTTERDSLQMNCDAQMIAAQAQQRQLREKCEQFSTERAERERLQVEYERTIWELRSSSAARNQLQEEIILVKTELSGSQTDLQLANDRVVVLCEQLKAASLQHQQVLDAKTAHCQEHTLQFETTITELETALSGTRQELMTSSLLNETITETLSELQREHAATVNRLSDQETQLTALRHKLSDTEQSLSCAKSELAETTQQLMSVNAELSQRQADQTLCQQRLADAEINMQQVCNDLSRARAECSDLGQQLQTCQIDGEISNSQLREALDTAQQLQASLQAQLDNVDALESKNATLTQHISAQNQALLSTEQLQLQSAQSIFELQQQLAAAQLQCDQHSVHVTALEAQIAEKSSALHTQSESLLVCERDCEELRAQLVATQAQLDACGLLLHESRLSDQLCHSQLSEATTAIAELQLKLSMAAESMSLQQQCTESAVASSVYVQMHVAQLQQEKDAFAGSAQNHQETVSELAAQVEAQHQLLVSGTAREKRLQQELQHWQQLQAERDHVVEELRVSAQHSEVSSQLLLQTAEIERQALETMCKRQQAELAELQPRLVSQDAALLQTQVSLKQCEADCEHLRLQLSSTQQSMLDMHNVIDQHVIDKRALHDNLLTTQNRLLALEESSSGHLLQLQAALDETRAHLRQARESAALNESLLLRVQSDCEQRSKLCEELAEEVESRKSAMVAVNDSMQAQATQIQFISNQLTDAHTRISAESDKLQQSLLQLADVNSEKMLLLQQTREIRSLNYVLERDIAQCLDKLTQSQANEAELRIQCSGLSAQLEAASTSHDAQAKQAKVAEQQFQQQIELLHQEIASLSDVNSSLRSASVLAERKDLQNVTELQAELTALRAAAETSDLNQTQLEHDLASAYDVRYNTLKMQHDKHIAELLEQLKLSQSAMTSAEQLQYETLRYNSQLTDQELIIAEQRSKLACLDELEQRLSSATVREADLMRKLESVTLERDTALENVHAHEQLSDALEAKLVATSQAHQEAMETLSSVKNDLAAVQQDFSDLSVQKEALSEVYDSLHGECVELRNERDVFLAQIAAFESEIATVRSGLKLQEADIVSKEATLVKVQSSAELSKAEYEEHANEIKRLSIQVETLQQDLEQTERTAENKLRDELIRSGELQLEIVRLSELLSNAEERLSQLAIELSTSTAVCELQVSSFTAEKTVLEERCALHQQALQAHEERVARLSQENEHLVQTVRSLEQQLGDKPAADVVAQLLDTQRERDALLDSAATDAQLLMRCELERDQLQHSVQQLQTELVASSAARDRVVEELARCATERDNLDKMTLLANDQVTQLEQQCTKQDRKIVQLRQQLQAMPQHGSDDMQQLHRELREACKARDEAVATYRNLSDQYELHDNQMQTKLAEADEALQKEQKENALLVAKADELDGKLQVAIRDRAETEKKQRALLLSEQQARAKAEQQLKTVSETLKLVSRDKKQAETSLTLAQETLKRTKRQLHSLQRKDSIASMSSFEQCAHNFVAMPENAREDVPYECEKCGAHSWDGKVEKEAKSAFSSRASRFGELHDPARYEPRDQ